MKTGLYYLSLFFVLIITFSSCKKDDVQTIATTTSITLTADKTTVLADGFDKITLKATDQNGADISDYSLIMVGSLSASKSIYFNYTQTGTYKVYAKRSGVTSDTLLITAASAGAAKYSTKVIMEEFVGTWAGWTPRLDSKIATYKAANAKVLSVAMHYKDALTNVYEDSILRYKLGVSAWPSAAINRRTSFNENGNVYNAADSTELSPFLKDRAVAGIAINSSISGNSLNVTTKVGFDVAISDSLKLIVLLTQDNVTLPQKNYYSNNLSYPANPFYALGDTITNYNHMAVFRKSPTTVLGTLVTATTQVKGGEFSLTNTIDITGYNAANLKVVAFVIFADNQQRIGVLNAQWVKAGQNQPYD